jgi:hypothetical protein
LGPPGVTVAVLWAECIATHAPLRKLINPFETMCCGYSILTGFQIWKILLFLGLRNIDVKNFGVNPHCLYQRISVENRPRSGCRTAGKRPDSGL